MSSTNRGYERHISDFYITPQEPIKQFMTKFLEIENFIKDILILDPCAGGNDKYDMPYPSVLNKLGFHYIKTNDERINSRAFYSDDYLKEFKLKGFDLIISNPPFNLALEFISKALEDVSSNGFIVFLLRLNFFGSEKRKEFFKENMPKYCFIHSKRISFFPEDINIDGKIYKKGSTDSIEYAHFVWQKGHKTEFTKTYLI